MTSKRGRSAEETAALLSELEGLAERIGVTVRYERLAQGPVRATHGSCRVHEQDLIIIDSRMDPVERLAVLSQEIRRFDIGGVFVPPVVRDWLGEPSLEGGQS